MKQNTISEARVTQKGRLKRAEIVTTQGRNGVEATEEGGEGGRRTRMKRRDNTGVRTTGYSHQKNGIKQQEEEEEGLNNLNKESVGGGDGRKRSRKGVRPVPLPVPPSPPTFIAPVSHLRRPSKQGGGTSQAATPPTVRAARRSNSDRYRTFVILGDGRRHSPRPDKLPSASGSFSSSPSSSFSSSSPPTLKSVPPKRFSTFLPRSSSVSSHASEGRGHPNVSHYDTAFEGDILMNDYRSSRAPGGSFSSGSFFRPPVVGPVPALPALSSSRQRSGRSAKWNIERKDARLGSAGSSVSSSSSSNNNNRSSPSAASSPAWVSARNSPRGGLSVQRNPAFGEVQDGGAGGAFPRTDVSVDVIPEAESCLAPMETLAEVHQQAEGCQQEGILCTCTSGCPAEGDSHMTFTIPEQSLKDVDTGGGDAGAPHLSTFTALPLQPTPPRPRQPSPSLCPPNEAPHSLSHAAILSPLHEDQEFQSSLSGKERRRGSKIPVAWPPLLPGSGLQHGGDGGKGNDTAGPLTNFEILVLKSLEREAASENWILRQHPTDRAPSLQTRPSLPSAASKKLKMRERFFGHETLTKVRHSFESLLLNQHSRAPQARPGNIASRKRVIPRLGLRKDSTKGSKTSKKDAGRPSPPFTRVQMPWPPIRQSEHTLSEGDHAPLWLSRDLNHDSSDATPQRGSDSGLESHESALRGTESPSRHEARSPWTNAGQLSRPAVVSPTQAAGFLTEEFFNVSEAEGRVRVVSEGSVTLPYEALKGSHYILEAAVQMPHRLASGNRRRGDQEEGVKGTTTWDSHARMKRRRRAVGVRKYNTVSRLSDIGPRKGILKKTFSGGSLPTTLPRRRSPRKSVVTYRLPSAPRASPSPRPPQPRAEVDAGYECDTELSVGEGESASTRTHAHAPAAASTHAPAPPLTPTAVATPSGPKKQPHPPPPPPNKPHQASAVSM